MNVTIVPSSPAGTIQVPPSKSITQRALVAGLLAGNPVVIHNPSICADTLAAIAMTEALGATVTRGDDHLLIESGIIPEGRVRLNCGESGLALRMFAPVAALLSESVTLTGEGSLRRRPVSMIHQSLSQLGVEVESNHGLLPLQLTGRLRGGRALIDGSSGSQLLTGLLMALPLAGSNSELTVRSLASKPYIELTLELLGRFGVTTENSSFSTFTIPGNQRYHAEEYHVEGDWSGAAFLLVAGAAGGRVTVAGLDPESRQADRGVIRVLTNAGAEVITGDGMITVSSSSLKAFTCDATDSPDLFPPLAALAVSCKGTSRIAGVGRLKHKESNRAEAIADVLAAMGIRVCIDGDEMLITGGVAGGAVVSSHNDHRIAMMAAILAAGASGPVTITGAEAVNKSYPDFYNDLVSLGVTLTY